MEVIALSPKNIDACAARAAEVLRTGGIVLYPTDTLYGLGADALSDEAVAKLYSTKARDVGKPIHCIVADIAMAEQYGVFGADARRIAEVFWPGPLTLVVPKKGSIHSGVARGLDTIGFRVPKHKLCITLAQAYGRPYTTTSANVSGKESLQSIGRIIAQLGPTAEQVELALDGGNLRQSPPSTVVRVVNDAVVVIRDGAIPSYEIFDALGRASRA